jgi:hypothetical protein
MRVGELTNPEIVTLAADLLGGQRRQVDSEDIAIKAFELAPNRFCWRKYTERIDIFAVRSALSDARKPRHGELLMGSARKGWQLTKNGVAFSKENADALHGLDVSRARLTPEEKNREIRERQRILFETAFRKAATNKLSEISIAEAERLFRVDDYVVGPARKSKVERLLSRFEDDLEIGPAIKNIAQIVPNK